MSGKFGRIRTTHAGSLPRPPQLRKLLAAAFAGEAVVAAELVEASATATRAAVKRQLETGIDVVNNGEQGRESFFTYVQHRMSGFGGSSERAVMRDTTAFPGYRERMVRASRAEHAVNRHCHVNRSVSQLGQLGSKFRPPCSRFAKHRTIRFEVPSTSFV